MAANIFEIENAIKNAFKKTVKDYRANKIELEEDYRACFYHYMRPFIDKNKDLMMLLSHNVQFVDKTIKPDVFIFRKNVYLVAIEIKCDTIANVYKKDNAIKDRNRLKIFSKDINRGIFIHIDKKDKNYTHKKRDWQNNYYVELYHIVESNLTACYEVKQKQEKHYRL